MKTVPSPPHDDRRSERDELGEGESRGDDREHQRAERRDQRGAPGFRAAGDRCAQLDDGDDGREHDGEHDDDRRDPADEKQDDGLRARPEAAPGSRATARDGRRPRPEPRRSRGDGGFACRRAGQRSHRRAASPQQRELDPSCPRRSRGLRARAPRRPATMSRTSGSPRMPAAMLVERAVRLRVSGSEPSVLEGAVRRRDAADLGRRGARAPRAQSPRFESWMADRLGHHGPAHERPLLERGEHGLVHEQRAGGIGIDARSHRGIPEPARLSRIERRSTGRRP